MMGEGKTKLQEASEAQISCHQTQSGHCHRALGGLETAAELFASVHWRRWLLEHLLWSAVNRWPSKMFIPILLRL